MSQLASNCFKNCRLFFVFTAAFNKRLGLKATIDYFQPKAMKIN